MVPNPRKTAVLFPGQGSQELGMGAALAAGNGLAADVFQEADRLLGIPLSRYCWEGPPEQLNSTEITQPALLTHSLAVWRAFADSYPDFRPAAAAGHSLGEFSALVAAGSLDFPSGLRLVRERGLAMRDAGQSYPGGMAAILGLEASQVDAVCQAVTSKLEGGVWIANDNCPGQTVISGDEQALDEASRRLDGAGARKIVRLAVSIAAHSPYMQAAQDRFRTALDQARIGDPEIAVYGNVEAMALRNAASVKADLDAQLTSNVRWTETIERMIADGIDTFVELGSGDVLLGLVRRIDRSVTRIHLDTPQSIQAFGG